VPYIANSDAENAALGAPGLSSGDPKADYKAVIDDINAHGGVAGRKLVPVFHRYDATSAQPSADQDQAACSDFTEDHHVAGVVSVGVTNNLTECVMKAGAVQVDASVLVGPDEGDFRQWPYYFDAGLISQDRLMAAYVPSLVRQHYFTGWNAATGQPAPGRPKLGVMSLNDPEWNRPVARVFLPALRKAGYSVASKDIISVYNPNSTAEDSQTLADIQNAVLRFRSDGVTHVIFLDTRGSFLTFFGKDAKAQRYFPRYGVDSGSAVQTIYDAGLADADQLNGAVGLGWNPGADLSPAAAAKYRTPATTRCLKVIRARSGQALSGADEQGVAISACDEVRLFAQAVDLAGPIINRDTLRAAIEGLGRGFVSAELPAVYFAPGRHDGGELGFDLAWDNKCSCAKYVNAPFRIP
jgi:ABC-type branched-subunit amino acid transport system substrate-binding protein